MTATKSANVSWLLNFRIRVFISLGPGSAMWEKGEKIGVGEKKKNKSASEASREVVWDVERVVLSPFPGYRSARFIAVIFPIWPRFLPFFCLLRSLVPGYVFMKSAVKVRVKRATKNLQLVLQHCCKTSWTTILRVLPPTKKTLQHHYLQDRFERPGSVLRWNKGCCNLREYRLLVG